MGLCPSLERRSQDTAGKAGQGALSGKKSAPPGREAGKIVPGGVEKGLGRAYLERRDLGALQERGDRGGGRHRMTSDDKKTGNLFDDRPIGRIEIGQADQPKMTSAEKADFEFTERAKTEARLREAEGMWRAVVDFSNGSSAPHPAAAALDPAANTSADWSWIDWGSWPSQSRRLSLLNRKDSADEAEAKRNC